jgi:hypothetical protein
MLVDIRFQKTDMMLLDYRRNMFSDSSKVRSMHWVGPLKHWVAELVHFVGGESRQVYSPLGGRARILVPPVCTPL